MTGRPLRPGVASWAPGWAVALAWLVVVASYFLPYLVVADPDVGDGNPWAGLIAFAMLLLVWAAWLPLAVTLSVARLRRGRGRSALGMAGTVWLGLLVAAQLAVLAYVASQLAEMLAQEPAGWGLLTLAAALTGSAVAAAPALTAWLAWRGQPARPAPAPPPR